MAQSTTPQLKIKWWMVAIFVLLIGGGWISGGYNDMVRGEENVKTSWSQVENQYQRRFDLVPNLVESVKGSMQQEKDVFGAIADARTRYAGSKGGDPSESIAAMQQYESALARLLVVMENYPELKSNENVQNLMVQLEGTENRVAVERGRYNEEVNQYNQMIRFFPKNLLAMIFGFDAYDRFESDEGAEKAPSVNFSNNS